MNSNAAVEKHAFLPIAMRWLIFRKIGDNWKASDTNLSCPDIVLWDEPQTFAKLYFLCDLQLMHN